MPKRPLIAIVDDDESVREALSDLVTEFGFRVAAFASAEDFLRSTHEEKTRCLILDVALPGMSGPDLQAALRAHHNRVPIVFITAQQESGIRPRLLDQGAVECLSKPFSDAALLSALNAAIPTQALPDEGVRWRR
jgi:FixJ family two-component response regulator